MRRVGRRVRVGLLVVVALAAGGGCGATPYARDPLVRDVRGVRGNRQAAAQPAPPPAEPVGPEAPPGPLIGDPAYAGLTSR
jgi:hypothetical protein